MRAAAPGRRQKISLGSNSSGCDACCAGEGCLWSLLRLENREHSQGKPGQRLRASFALCPLSLSLPATSPAFPLALSRLFPVALPTCFLALPFIILTLSLAFLPRLMAGPFRLKPAALPVTGRVLLSALAMRRSCGQPGPAGCGTASSRHHRPASARVWGRRMKKLRTLAVQPRYPADAPATGVWSNTLNLPRAGSRVQGGAARYQRPESRTVREGVGRVQILARAHACQPRRLMSSG